MKNLSRREALFAGFGTVASVAFLPTVASATPEAVEAEIKGWSAKAVNAKQGNLVLTAPEIAENGNTVPVEVEAPGAVEIKVFADGNPDPRIFGTKFGPASGEQRFQTRIRMAGTQNVIAVAQYADGSFARVTAAVKVTIGGCGG